MKYVLDVTRKGIHYDRTGFSGATRHEWLAYPACFRAGATKVRWKFLRGLNNGAKALVIELPGKLGIHKFAKELGYETPFPASYLELTPMP